MFAFNSFVRSSFQFAVRVFILVLGRPSVIGKHAFVESTVPHNLHGLTEIRRTVTSTTPCAPAEKSVGMTGDPSLLAATEQLYNSLCRSVGRSVGLSVSRSVKLFS